MTKRILLLDTGNEWGGGTNSMIELMKRIDRNRFDVSALFYRNYAKGKNSSLAQELANIGIPLTLLSQRKQPLPIKIGKELIRGLCSPLPKLRASLLYKLECNWRIHPNAKRIADLLHNGRYDLLYMNNQPSSNLEGYLAAEMAGIPVVQHCRIETQLSKEEREVTNRVARHIICVSEGVKESLLLQGVRSSICSVVHNAIDGKQALPAAVALPEIQPGTVVFGSVGSLIVRKANDHLLHAAALLMQRCNLPFHLLLVGEGSQHSALSSLAAELGLSNQITFAGFQTNPLAWSSRMDVLVLASAKEGLPRTILEAMLLGKPVIASNIIGTRELVQHAASGYLYPYGDISQLAEHMETLLKDEMRRKEFGTQGRNTVLRDFSIEAYVADVEHILATATQ